MRWRRRWHRRQAAARARREAARPWGLWLNETQADRFIKAMFDPPPFLSLREAKRDGKVQKLKLKLSPVVENIAVEVML